MAIASSAKKARNTSESGSTVLKKKRHSELEDEALSSSKQTPSKKSRLSEADTSKNQVPSKYSKFMQNKQGGSGKKKETVVQAKRTPKLPIKKGTPKTTHSEGDEEESDEDDEGGSGEEMEEDETSEDEETNVNDIAEDSDDDVEEDDDEEQEESDEEEDSEDENESNVNNKADDAASDDAADEDDSNEEENDEEEDEATEKSAKKEKSFSKHRQSEGDDKDSKNLTVFVLNVPYGATKEDLKKFFGIAGAVKDVRIPVENRSGRPRGFAFVTFEDEDGFKAALEMDNEEMEGRPLKVQESNASRGEGGGRGRFQRGGGGRGFRGGRGFGRGDRGGGGRGFGRGDRGGRGFGRGDRGGRSFGRGGGGRSFRDRRDDGSRPFQKRGGGRSWQDRDRSSENQSRGGDSD